MNKLIDPRTKLLIVVCLSTLGVLYENVWILSGILIVGIVISFFLKVNFITAIGRMQKLLYVVVFIIIMQSLFISEGNVIFSIGKMNILTDVGIIKGIEYILRIMIILLSGTIIVNINDREFIQGLVQMRLPYEIAFMVSLGIKFMPILMDEIKNTVTAIQLRGIDIKRLKFRDRLNIISYTFTPIIVSTLMKAKKISVSVEARGFRAYDNRTSLKQLTFRRIDYVIMVATIISFGSVLCFIKL